MPRNVKITVVGAGYVGLSNALLLAQHNVVTLLDINAQKTALINAGKSPIVDKDIDSFLQNRNLLLKATTEKTVAFQGAESINGSMKFLINNLFKCRSYIARGF